jgi:hypothetical protein
VVNPFYLGQRNVLAWSVSRQSTIYTLLHDAESPVLMVNQKAAEVKFNNQEHFGVSS